MEQRKKPCIDTMGLIFSCKRFTDLEIMELYQLMELRQKVFVVEQDCVYLDVDGKDPESLHLLGYSSGKLLAYARLVKAGIHYPEHSIGRIAVDPDFRRYGLGIAVMEEAIRILEEKYGKTPIRIEAQSHLKSFYQKFSFKKVGEEYILDGIPHIEMLRN